MSRGIQRIIELMVERFFPLIGGLFGSTVETYHALGLAEQQSQLEEAARRYEAEGKPDIAQSLRRQARELAADDPAARALRIAENVSAGRLLPPDSQQSASDAPGPTDSRQTKRKSSRKKISFDEPDSRQ